MAYWQQEKFAIELAFWREIDNFNFKILNFNII